MSLTTLRFRGFCCLCLCGLSLLLASPALAKKILNDTFILSPFSHHIWQEVLSESVDSTGQVDFDELRASPKRLNQYLAQLALVSPQNRPDLFPTQAARLAYWINAHNALALRLILDVYPVQDLADVPAFRNSHRYSLGGLPYSLMEIEQLIGERFPPWPEAPFGISDITQSSPPLLNQAYRPEVLQVQLHAQAQNFLQDPQQVQVEGTCVGLSLSPFFKTYEAPFLQALQRKKGVEHPTLLDFLKPYLAPEQRGEFARPCNHGITFQPSNTKLRGLFSE